MADCLRFEIKNPEGINVKVKDKEVSMKKDDNEIKRKLNSFVSAKIDNNKIILTTKKTTKMERKMAGTITAHVKNMIKGLTDNFMYTLQVASVHFPMTVNVDKENNEFVVKNFLGEKKDRRIKTIKGISINIEKDIIKVESSNKELAGQFAANLEKLTRVRNKDRRIFQDGIYIIEKPNRRIL